jgi:ubiquinol-cytochrome c reductase cytochrome b subunit
MSSDLMRVAEPPAKFLDERIGLAKLAKGGLRKVFPDHWSFMLGEIALYSFIILLLSGTFLSLWYKPSLQEGPYTGSYGNLYGVTMSDAMASTLRISFDIRGGLLLRQIHHWAAILFLAAMTVHMMRTFFTGAFRKPRELNWVLGSILILLGIIEGFTGYSLPDDLLSGTGLRIAQAIVLGIPIVGTYLAYFVFGGGFPGGDWEARFYGIHILLIPAAILGLITAHLILVVVNKHTQYPGPGRTERNVVGYPLFPVYMAKAGGFFFVVFGVVALMGALFQINPIWLYGPYDAAQVSAGSQPDWYMGWLDGAVRIMPGWETVVGGFVISWNILIPTLVVPGLLTTALVLYPWIEKFVTKDENNHNILDRPRNQATRTALGAMGLTFYAMLLFAGGNDILATHFHLSINVLIWTFRALVFLAPPATFFITRKICIGLQQRDRDLVLHGMESGMVRQSPDGAFSEVHTPLPQERVFELTQHADQRPLELLSEVDENGVARPHAAKERLRARMSNFFYSPNVEHVTEDEVRTAWAHRDHTELDAADHGQPAAAIEGSGDEVGPGRDSVQSQSLTGLRD